MDEFPLTNLFITVTQEASLIDKAVILENHGFDGVTRIDDRLHPP